MRARLAPAGSLKLSVYLSIIRCPPFLIPFIRDRFALPPTAESGLRPHDRSALRAPCLKPDDRLKAGRTAGCPGGMEERGRQEA